MNGLRVASCILVAALGITTHASVAAAQSATPISCATAFGAHLDEPHTWLNIIGTRLTARGAFGFTSFTMQDGFQLSATPLGTPGAALESYFTAGADAARTRFTGRFTQVFPGRGNTDVETSEFWVYRSGAVWLRSVTYNGAWTQLQNATCFSGPQDQTVVTGRLNNPGFGTDFWTFLVRTDTLI